MKYSIFFIFMLWMQTASAQMSSVAPNFRIYPGDVVHQTETFITVHPGNPNILFAAANTLNSTNGFRSEGVYASTNGGVSWFGSDTCKGNPIAFHSGDPTIAITNTGTFIMVRLGATPIGIYSHYSTDNGIAWSNQKTVIQADVDRPAIITDGQAGSPFLGRTYGSFIRFAPPYPVYFFYSTDDGQNWSTPVQVNNPSQRSQGAEMQLGPNGRLYLTWAGVINSSPFTEDFVGFAWSSNGGANWNVNENIFDMNGIQGLLTQKGNIRINGLPKMEVDLTGGSRHGWIYIITTEKNNAPAGSDPDIILHRSSDGGATWSSGIRVNQDPINNGKIQLFPAINVDATGAVNIIYYDDRRTTSDSAEVFMSRSTDGGNSWIDFPISDHKFKPVPIGGFGQGYMGDNIDIVYSNNNLHPVWMDNSSGKYQIWTSIIPLSTIGIVQVSTEVPAHFEMKQNYPNPFNPTTSIQYSLTRAAFVKLAVYNLSGELVSTIANERQSAGQYIGSFDASALPSGAYIYRLTADGKSISKKMVVVK